MQPPETIAAGEVDISATLRRLAKGWVTIVAALAIALTAAVIYLNLSTYEYAVAMRIAPVATSGGDGLSSRFASLGGLAAVAGVSLPDSGGSASFKLYVESLHSRDVANILSRDPALMHKVFVREWDDRAKAWRLPSGIFHDATVAIKSLLGLPILPWAPPSAARLQQWMQEKIGVEQNIKTPVVTVTLSSDAPVFAAHFLDRLGSTVDELLRERALLRTNEYIQYLSQRMATITLAEQRVAVAQALGEQERIKMAASSDRPYAAEVFDHPSASDRPVSPSPAKVLTIALVLGLVSGIGLVLTRPLRMQRSAGGTP